VADVVKELQSFFLNVHVHDPYASSEELHHEYGFGLTSELANDYDAVIVTVGHEPYMAFDNAYFESITKEGALIADLKGTYRNKLTGRQYWSF
jgi:UDP-N-acetyl-D-galactosamine dehydrogenase